MIDNDIKDMVEKGLVSVDRHGEMSLTGKGLDKTQNLLKENPVYMKKVIKRFDREDIPKETVNIKDLQNELDKVDSIELGIYERYGISDNDNLKNYQLFCKFVEEDRGMDSETTFQLLKKSKYFEIPNNMNLLLQNTSNKIREVQMPHYLTFLDFSIVIYDRVFHSMLITDLISIAKKLKKNDIPKKIDVITFFSCEEGIGRAKFDLTKPNKDKYIKKLQEYIMNFVDFVNNEDVRWMSKERTDKNTERRIKKGKLPIPSFNKIYVIGYLAKYLKQLESQEINSRLTHRFWVRGHFKRYWNKKRYSKLYSKFRDGKLEDSSNKKYKMVEGVLREWIYPYIKGDGILIEKEYMLK